MKIVVNRKETIDNVGRVGCVATKNASMPILENVKISIRTDGMIVVNANDLEMSSTRKFRGADSFTEGIEFCINPRDLVGVLKTIKDDTVILNITETQCIVEHIKGTTALPTLPADDFPAIKNDADTIKVEMSTEKLFEWLKNGVKFTSKDKLRPQLCGVHLYVGTDEIGVAASDSTFLYADYEKFANTDNVSVSVTIGTKVVPPLLDMINGEEKVVVRFGENTLSFRVGNAMLTCMRIVGKYPNFKQVIARKEDPITVVVDKAELLDSATRAILSASNTVLLKITVKDQMLSLDSEDLGFNKSGHEELSCEHEGEDIEIGVKGSNLIGCLESIESSKVIFELHSAKHPMNVMESERPNKNIILMPMLLR